MKRKIIIGMLLALAFSVSACSVRQVEEKTTAVITEVKETTQSGERETDSQPQEDVTGADTTGDDVGDTSNGEKHITEEEALAAAKAYLGDKDPDTGYKYSFVSQGTMQDTDTGEEFYKILVSWYLPEDDRYSVCGYLLVSRNGKTVTKFDW